jgi:hypothetical protein
VRRGFKGGHNGGAGGAHRVGENRGEASARPDDDSSAPAPGVVRW